MLPSDGLNLYDNAAFWISEGFDEEDKRNYFVCVYSRRSYLNNSFNNFMGDARTPYPWGGLWLYVPAVHDRP